MDLAENEILLWEGKPQAKAYYLQMIIGVTRVAIMLWVSCVVFVFSLWVLVLGKYLTLENTFRVYALVGLVAWLLLLLYTHAEYPLRKFWITSEHVIFTGGLFKRTSRFFALKDITKVVVKKGWGDMVAGENTGSLFISTPQYYTKLMFKHDDEPRKIAIPVCFNNIVNPEEVANVIRQGKI